jgi:hypothetical protein
MDVLSLTRRRLMDLCTTANPSPSVIPVESGTKKASSTAKNGPVIVAPLTPTANDKEKLGCNSRILRPRCEY